MDVTFIPADPHGRARPVLDVLLSNGTDRIMVACAFCTGAGLAIMYRHLQRLRAPDSRLVVSAEPPTDIDGVNELAKEAPGSVWIHKTGKLPYETKVGSALMHSKVFYSEAREKCWLWVGSHNLTGRAIGGGNLEAALLLGGHPLEAPFVAARKHIEDCLAEASPCPFELPSLPDGEGVDVAVIHAEADELPRRSIPWHVLLCLRAADYDGMLRPVADVRLHLYRRGGLASGWRNSVPCESYGGKLTGLNMTEFHPDSPGIPATWSDEHFSITEERDVLHFSRMTPSTRGIVTQAVIKIEGSARPDEVFLSAKPKVVSEEQNDRQVLGVIDSDIASFFSRGSLENGHLVYEVRHRGPAKWMLPVSDLREEDQRQLIGDAQKRHIDFLGTVEEDPSRIRHPFIMRAKYQLRRRQEPQ